MKQITETKKSQSIAKIAAQIEELFNEGKNDEEIAKALDTSAGRVATIRTMMGLAYRKAINVFEESKKVSYNKSSEVYEMKFSIPISVHQKLGIKDGEEYQFFASIVKPKTIQITLIEAE